MIAEHNKTYIGKLQVRVNSRDSLATRIRLDSAFSTLELKPSGLPQSAVLFIRRLCDPLPGLIPRDLVGGLPDAWGRAVAAAIDDLARRAARPALEAVAADAESVLFLDRSELLACLAADWLHGRAITRWWWQSLFRATDLLGAVVNEWLTSIRYVPAAFAKLAQNGDAVPFVRALPAGATGKLLDELIRHFGLNELSKAISVTKTEMHSRKPLSPGEAFRLRTQLAPEAFSPNLEQDARAMLSVALMLERAPSLLRERDFASRLFASLLVDNAAEAGREQYPAEQPQVKMDPLVDLRPSGAESLPRPLPVVPMPNDEAFGGVESAAITEQQRPAYRSQGESPLAASAGPREPQSSGVLTSELRLTPDGAQIETTSGSAAKSIAEHRQTLITEAEARVSSETKTTATTIELAIETKLGGLFYLINAALALELYRDFTRPLEPGIDLSIWDFLALAGGELIGKRIEADAIWPLLARLAGREVNELPGSRFEPPDEWRVPPDWLNAFPERDEWSYQTSRGRLIVWHPAGFQVCNVRLGSRPPIKDLRTRLASETQCYSTVAGFQRRRIPPDADRRRKRERTVDRWTKWIADYLRVRLGRSLGVALRGDLTAMLFARAARIEVTPARLDVFLSLAELPIEIRLAGLDRDPGWVPAAGRAIAFHYD